MRDQYYGQRAPHMYDTSPARIRAGASALVILVLVYGTLGLLLWWFA